MDIENIAVSNFINAFEFRSENLEYVHDIGMRKDYGVAVRGKLDYNGDKISVIGSVVLDKKTGKPNYSHEETAFVVSFVGKKESKKIFTDKDAVNAMNKLYTKVNNDGNMFKKRSNVDIDFLAT
jgi:hypothetical protein